MASAAHRDDEFTKAKNQIDAAFEEATGLVAACKTEQELLAMFDSSATIDAAHSAVDAACAMVQEWIDELTGTQDDLTVWSAAIDAAVAATAGRKADAEAALASATAAAGALGATVASADVTAPAAHEPAAPAGGDATPPGPVDTTMAGGAAAAAGAAAEAEADGALQATI